jgi:hypothetical protein
MSVANASCWMQPSFPFSSTALACVKTDEHGHIPCRIRHKNNAHLCPRRKFAKSGAGTTCHAWRCRGFARGGTGGGGQGIAHPSLSKAMPTPTRAGGVALCASTTTLVLPDLALVSQQVKASVNHSISSVRRRCEWNQPFFQFRTDPSPPGKASNLDTASTPGVSLRSHDHEDRGFCGVAAIPHHWKDESNCKSLEAWHPGRTKDSLQMTHPSVFSNQTSRGERERTRLCGFGREEGRLREQSQAIRSLVESHPHHQTSSVMPHPISSLASPEPFGFGRRHTRGTASEKFLES